MIITPNLTAPTPAASANSTGSGTSGVSDLFLQLLATQLKTQSPVDPVDPTAFVGQLIQFNSLDQLTQIRELLASSTSNQAAPVAAQSTRIPSTTNPI
jgi:flagellar basal-body rod modification protein FlgD